MHVSSVVALLSLCLATSGSFAADLTAGEASKIIDGCVMHANGKNQSHAIAVADTGGHLIALLRMDGNSSGIAEFAVQKALAVAAWRFSTRQMEAAVKDTPGFANAPSVVTVPGGVPVFSKDGQFIGSVGVSGEAPADDAECAAAGIRAASLVPASKRSE